MNEFHVRLRLLAEILIKKKDALMFIRNICINEETVISSGIKDELLLKEMAAEKQTNINIVLETDELFQSSYDAIKDEFELKAKEYKEDVLEIKELINSVCDLDIKIRLQENSNKKLMKDTARPVSQLPKNKVAELYKKNSS